MTNHHTYCHNTHWLKSDSDKSNYVGYYDATSLYPSSGINFLNSNNIIILYLYLMIFANSCIHFLELDDMPVGTGTLFVQHSKNSNVLIRESRTSNVTETQEAQVIQYIANGGFQHYSKILSKHDVPSQIISSLHAGPGQLCFGHTRQQRADLILIFKPTSLRPSVIFVHNYHGSGPYGHYDGHISSCRLYDGSDQSQFKPKEESEELDDFRYKLASVWSVVNSSNLIVEYSISYACSFFCGNPLDSLVIDNNKKYISIHELLHLDFPQPNDTIFIPQSSSSTRKIINIKQLENDILNGQATGFVTLKGGHEKMSENACDFFGFCVQKIKPTTRNLSEFTINQIKTYYNLKTSEEVDIFLSTLPSRTLNSTTFFEEETISTTYLKWLMEERGFSNFRISHFIAYKFSNYSREFLAPLLQQRHEYKQLGNMTAAASTKLSLNSNYG